MARPPETDAATVEVLAALRHRGLLLQAGHEYPSIADLVAGEPIRGSWWAHPCANLIYWVCQDLDAHPDVAEARLLARKVTHLFRPVWADVAAVALADEAWQWDGVGASARDLVARTRDGPVRTDEIDWCGPGRLGDTCRLLESRLLVKAEEVHTESGRHAKVLNTWRSWWRANASGELPDAETARSRLEARLGASAHLLPWHARKPGRISRTGARGDRRTGRRRLRTSSTASTRRGDRDA